MTAYVHREFASSTRTHATIVPRMALAFLRIHTHTHTHTQSRIMPECATVCHAGVAGLEAGTRLPAKCNRSNTVWAPAAASAAARTSLFSTTN